MFFVEHFFSCEKIFSFYNNNNLIYHLCVSLNSLHNNCMWNKKSLWRKSILVSILLRLETADWQISFQWGKKKFSFKKKKK